MGIPRCRRSTGPATSDLAITVISLEEQLSGGTPLLRKARRPDDLARVYQRLVDTVRSMAPLTILPFTTSAIARYQQLIQLETECPPDGSRELPQSSWRWWYPGHPKQP